MSRVAGKAGSAGPSVGDLADRMVQERVPGLYDRYFNGLGQMRISRVVEMDHRIRSLERERGELLERLNRVEARFEEVMEQWPVKGGVRKVRG